jgi:hypothetical protein
VHALLKASICSNPISFPSDIPFLTADTLNDDTTLKDGSYPVFQAAAESAAAAEASYNIGADGVVENSGFSVGADGVVENSGYSIGGDGVAASEASRESAYNIGGDATAGGDTAWCSLCTMDSSTNSRLVASPCTQQVLIRLHGARALTIVFAR